MKSKIQTYGVEFCKLIFNSQNSNSEYKKCQDFLYMVAKFIYIFSYICLQPDLAKTSYGWSPTFFGYIMKFLCHLYYGTSMTRAASNN
jgi:hypothetical protein